VWNEPNLEGFWERADREAYFQLYVTTAKTIKAIDPTLQVGGPATAGAAWVPEFLDHAYKNGAPVDFVTTHSYGVEGGFLDEDGHGDNKLVASPDAIVGDARRVRQQISESKFPLLPLYFTEWSTSYSPRDPVHDSYISAAYILNKLKATQGLVQGMSYWTYTDLFEEPGPPPTPFHGGFGLINREGIRKPAFFAYKYLHALRGKEIPTGDAESLVATDGVNTAALIWDWKQPEQTVSNRPFFTKLVPASAASPARLTFRHLRAGLYRLQLRRTGFRANDAYSAYLEMGAPASLSDSDLKKLRDMTRDAPQTDRRISVASSGEYTVEIPMRSNDVVLVTLTAESSGAGVMRDMTSLQLAKQMSPGWNLGNSLEAIGGETAWGNPMVTQELMNAVKSAGFKSVRIPASWAQYADANDNISPAWMARVTEVVNYARSAGLYVMLNIHWDGGWMQPTPAKQAYVNARLTRFWTQIANNFRDYDDHLLFAGSNEVMVDGDYGTPTVEYSRVQNSFNQAFVDAVRATGGNNATRHLVVQGFNTNINYTVKFAVLPNDSANKRLMMEVHYYDPYNFTINDKSSIWQWGAIATGPSFTEPWGNEAWADAQFQKMKTRFIDGLGVPVIMGEYGAMLRSEYDSTERYRIYWHEYITRSAYQHGLVPVYWDNGYTDDHQMGLFDRATGTAVHSGVIRAIVNSVQ
jgi:endoglucanase